MMRFVLCAHVDTPVAADSSKLGKRPSESRINCRLSNLLREGFLLLNKLSRCFFLPKKREPVASLGCGHRNLARTRGGMGQPPAAGALFA